MADYFVNQPFCSANFIRSYENFRSYKSRWSIWMIMKNSFLQGSTKAMRHFLEWLLMGWVSELRFLGDWILSKTTKISKIEFFVVTEINHELNTKLSIKLSLYIFQNPEVGVPNPSLTRTSTFKVPPSLQVILSKCTVGATQVRRAVQNEIIIVILIVFSV